MKTKIRAPELEGADTWFNSEPLSIKDLRGKVVLVDFWTYTCVNCLRTLPFVKEWYERYKDKGLVVIGVHTPEFRFEKEPANVERFIKNAGIEYPVVTDNYNQIWNRFATKYWPSKYLIDADGYIRYSHFGEGAYASTEEMIQQLIKDINPALELGPISELAVKEETGKVCYPTTPETYTGYARGALGNLDKKYDRVFEFEDTETHYEGRYYLNGAFEIEPGFVRHARRTETPGEDYFSLYFKSFEVNVVMKAAVDEEFLVYLELDDRPIDKSIKGNDVEYDFEGRSYVKVTEPRMFNLIQNTNLLTHKLKLMSVSDQLEIYAFTFGACAKELAA